MPSSLLSYDILCHYVSFNTSYALLTSYDIASYALTLD